MRIGIAVVAVSMLCAGATQFVGLDPPSVHVEVKPVAAIVESPSTIGVADPSLYFASTTEIDTTLDALQSLGVQNVRIQIPWAAVQKSGPTSYDWTAVDQMITAATARNMGVLGVLNATPFWAGTPYLSGQPAPQAYATFASAVASRYAGKISAYEIWNEPNAYMFLSPADPAGYTRLLKAAYPAIKAADPAAIVVGGVVGAGVGIDNLTVSPQAFIAGMYAAGAKGSFDALSFHPYQFFLPFSAGASVADSPLNQLAAIRQLMVANGDGTLKIWATEYGEPSSVVTEQQQAAYIKDFLTTWQTEDGAGPIFLHTVRDSAFDINVSDSLGLFSSGWTPKLAALMIKNFITGNPDPTPSAIAVGAVTALAVTINQITGIPLRIVAYVAGVVNDVISTISAVIQRITAFAQGVVTAITAPFVPAARSAVVPPAARTATATITVPPEAPVRSTATEAALAGDRATAPSTKGPAGAGDVASPPTNPEATVVTAPSPAVGATPPSESAVSVQNSDPPGDDVSPSAVTSAPGTRIPKPAPTAIAAGDSPKTGFDESTGATKSPTVSHSTESQSAASKQGAAGTDSHAQSGPGGAGPDDNG
ncbi:cellulase family glycosylhydrolase [Mycolicibacterium sp.]|uniref:cellulase family glycosylhydrolase n=1 Tax=Mycolicibacterium sp. TaxID=2320850 RepID=UPI001A30B7DC|nr:cellulase family glycosylhydrolase [Mycolicibacterium sp.]MBJ7340968.1 cellulase family glycosylhydrolase [Mycolicibacterium sp.]